MKTIVQWSRLLCLLLAIALVGCSPKEQKFKWTEDVKLQDGQVITIKRESIFRGKRQTFSDELVWYAVEFQHPATKETIHWESRRFFDTKELGDNLSANPEVLPALLLQAILLKGSELYVVADAGLHDVFRYLHCPDPPYLIFKWDRAQWKRVPIENIPYKKFMFNVSSSDYPTVTTILNKSSDGHVGLDGTTQRLVGAGQPAVIDLTRMSKQIVGEENCRSKRTWTEREAFSN